MAISFLGSSPTVGLPSRRIRESCFSESSGISEKSIFLRFVVFPFLPARSPRADDTRDLFIVSSPFRICYDQHSASAAFRQTQSAQLTPVNVPGLHHPSRPRQEKPWRLLQKRLRA